MSQKILCPYFSKKEDLCNAGFHYVDLKDAKEILNICIFNFQNCQRYIQLNRQLTPYLLKSSNIKGREYHGEIK
ncbi:MAG: hypothetical protein OHK0040_05620 [bacterium]